MIKSRRKGAALAVTAFLAAAFFALAAVFIARPAAAVEGDVTATLNAARAEIRGIDAVYDDSIDSAAGTPIYANNLTMSWNEAQTLGETTSEYAIFEYVLETGYDGASVPAIHWGNGMLFGYSNIVSQGNGTVGAGYHAGYNFQSFAGNGTNSPLTDTANEGKRIFVIINRSNSNAAAAQGSEEGSYYSLVALDEGVSPVFGTGTNGLLTVTNGTDLGKFSTWAGQLNGTNVGFTVPVRSNIINMRMCGFTFDGGTATISDLKCYDETGKDLGIVFGGFDFKTTNLDEHENDDYWTTGSPSDANFVAPVNYNFTQVDGTGTVLTPGTSPSFNQSLAYTGSGFFSDNDATFTESDFGPNNDVVKSAVLIPAADGGVITFTRHDTGYHKYALEFGKTININEIDSVTMRIWGSSLTYHNIYTANSVCLFNLTDTECVIGPTAEQKANYICISNYVPQQYTPAQGTEGQENYQPAVIPQDFIEITVNAANLACLADENGDISGFQLIMRSGPGIYDTFCIDWIKVNSAEISQASVTLSDDIALNVYANVSEDYYTEENMPQADFTLNGNTQTVTGELQEGNLFKFTFTGITPQYMNAQVSVSLKVVRTAGYEVADTIESISVLSYCEALLASSAEDLGLTEAKFAAMQTLIADLLNYGAAAQTYTGVNTDDLVNADLGDVTGTTPSGAAQDKLNITGDANAAVVHKGARLWFDYNAGIGFAAEVSGEVTKAIITLDGTQYTIEAADFTDVNVGGVACKEVRFSEIKATQFDKEVTLQFYAGDTAIGQAVTYSINSYAARISQSASAEEKALVDALYRYGLGATAYVAAQ